MPNKVEEKTIIQLLTNKPLTFEQVGKLFGVSKQYIHQIYQRAEAKDKKIKRYSILTIKNHRVGLCDICQKLVKILNQYDIVARNALAERLEISRNKISYHLSRVREAKLIPTEILLFNSDRMARAFVGYKTTDKTIYRVGVLHGYKNFTSRIDRMGKKGIDISRHPDKFVRALL